MQTFGTWLAGQAKRDDWVGLLGSAVAKDPAFPRDGDAHAARVHLSSRQASGDDFEALDDAELEYEALQ